MKKLIPTLVFLMCLHFVSGQDRDKVLHYIGGNLFGLAGAGIAKHVSDGNRWWTFAGAVGGSTLVGLGKEAIDASQREGGWDNEDLLATILGGVTVGVVIDIAGGKKQRKLKAKNSTASMQMFFDDDWSNQSLEYLESLDRMPSITELSMTRFYMQLQTD
ncbi:hypothetical protein [Croceitalea rosinachiae]|uniref:Lipoprotein n=1 Tax=Croceitalea rosinachiae TaxID=3075596 RepID=A0ABU3AEE4_9FLAO|nr:hypothetical protein [Croceitalea sp. F388]MDT0608556.1 hypothetical protein [Croceitalea sp. F388]